MTNYEELYRLPDDDITEIKIAQATDGAAWKPARNVSAQILATADVVIVNLARVKLAEQVSRTTSNQL